MRAAILCGLLAGCGPGDPCDSFPGETCFSLEVRGPGLTVDQVGVRALSGFPLDDGRSPPSAGGGFGLPVRLAVLPEMKSFAGAVELEVRGFFAGVVLGLDNVHATIAAGQHLGIIAELGNHTFDLAGVDFSGRPDLARPADLAMPPGADLSVPPGADLAGASTFVVETSSVTNSEFTGVWGTSSGNVYIVSLAGDILHSTGNGVWTQQRTRGAGEVYNVIWGTGADDVWAGGGFFPCGSGTSHLNCQPQLQHSTGNGSWQAITPPGSDANFVIDIKAIGGTGKTDLYFSVSGTMANNGVLHSVNDGGNFTLQAFGSQSSPTDLFAASPTDIYAVRSVGDVLHSTGNGMWPKQADLQSGDLADYLFGASATAIYAAGSNFNSNLALVYFSTGNGVWTPQVTSQTVGTAQSMTGSAANDLYALYSCALLHSTGNGSWSEVPLPVTGCNLRRAWAAPDGQVFVVGKTGLILHKR